LERLRATVESLLCALDAARAVDAVGDVSLAVIDNGTPDHAGLDELIASELRQADWLRTHVMRGHGNVGYGAGHNLAIQPGTRTYHLVLNPDVVLEPAAILEGIRYLSEHPRVGLVTPHVVNEAGQREFLCKRYPSVIGLALRGFAPRWLRRPFRRLLERYEMRDLPEHEATTDVSVVSGCFMLFRGTALQSVGGFSPDYFLYFEDFDLSLRLRRVADIAYVPQVRIVHAGGYAAQKGWGHQRLFLRSAVTFFGRHGWRLW
jgi:GT2 family glycosyltransferase